MRAAALVVALALAGCASDPGPAASTASEAELVDFGSQMLGTLIEEKSRLLDVAHRLTTASAERCGSLARPRIGALVGSGGTAETEWLREAMARDHGLTDELRVIHLVPGGAFERAGVRVGDALLSIDGKTPRSLGALRQTLLAERLALFRLRFRRGDREWASTLRLDLACPVQFELAAEAELLVRTRDKIIALVPRGLLVYAETDDRLAAALAHQLAHILYDVAGQTDRAAEQRADRHGIALAALADFDPSEAIPYWEDMARVYPWLVLPRPDVARPVAGRVPFGGSPRERRRWIAWYHDHHDLARRMGGLRRALAADGNAGPPAD